MTDKNKGQKPIKEVDRLTNQLAYLQADIDNLRKHYAKEREQLVKLSNKNLISDLLTIIDDFEQAIINEPKNKGVNMIYKKLLTILQKYGLKPISCVGEEFDSERHEALVTGGKGLIITEELQKGYMLNNFIIRTSKVKVGELND